MSTGSVTVQYFDRNTQQPVDLTFEDADFEAAGQSLNTGKPELFSVFTPVSWSADEVKGFQQSDRETWINWITSNAITSQEFLGQYRTELDTLFKDLLNHVPVGQRTPNNSIWQSRQYYPKNQKAKEKKEKLQTFAAFIYYLLLSQLGLPTSATSQRLYNADGTKYSPLQERLERCGMGYFYECKQEDLVTMYLDARALLLKHKERVLTPGMVMAKIFTQSPDSKTLARDHASIYTEKLTRLTHATGGTNGAYMCALMYAADKLKDKNINARGFVKGGKTERNNNIKKRPFKIGEASTHSNVKPKDLGGLNKELGDIQVLKSANRRNRAQRFARRVEAARATRR